MRHRVGTVIVGVVLVIGSLSAGFLLFHGDTAHQAVTVTVATASVGPPVDCQVAGVDMITVPDLIGVSLGDAVTRARASGLQVVGMGTSSGDPSGPAAMVRAQNPEQGLRVPAGACIGFRTKP